MIIQAQKTKNNYQCNVVAFDEPIAPAPGSDAILITAQKRWRQAEEEMTALTQATE